MIYSIEEIKNNLQNWKNESKSIVFTNGCFDLLHRGHENLLIAAKSKGDILIVGLNSDSSVRQLKGNSRPIESQNIRAKKLSKLEVVNGICIFKSKTPKDLIQTIKPNVLVKGGDYKKGLIVGSNMIKSWGGKVVIIPLTKGFSTTLIIEKNRR
tara:strand:+ start:250 stop:711 length:462 start_codon:yes stop_codon:yes gene_type:complete